MCLVGVNMSMSARNRHCKQITGAPPHDVLLHIETGPTWLDSPSVVPTVSAYTARALVHTSSVKTNEIKIVARLGTPHLLNSCSWNSEAKYVLCY